MGKNSYKYWLLLFFVFVIHYRSISAQDRIIFDKQEQIIDDRSINSVGNDIEIGLNTASKLISSPANFEKKDWILGGLTLATTCISFLVDNDIRDYFKKNRSPFMDNIANIGLNYGDALYAIAFSGAIYTGGKIFKEDEYSTTGRMLLESLLFAGITTSILKSIIGRSRPYTEEGPSKFNGFQFRTETTSFPSGHVTVAFAMSSVLSERIDNVYASILLYSLAGSTLFQRIYDDKHWFSDTILAAVIGYTIGKAVVKFDNDQKTNYNLILSNYNTVRLNLKYSF